MSSVDWRFSPRFFKGRAKIRLCNLDVTTTSTRTTREEHIHALVQKFQSEGCVRLNPDNYVKLLVPSDFRYASSLSDHISSDDEVLDLPDHVRISVLHGKHRILAADRALWDKWWITDFYTENLPEPFQLIIREEHPNAQSFGYGDIYQNIRKFQRLGDVDAEIEWRGRFSKTAQREMHRLEKDFKKQQSRRKSNSCYISGTRLVGNS